VSVVAATMFALVLVGFAAWSRVLERLDITAPLVFTAVGGFVGIWLVHAPQSTLVRGLAEVTLALVLFHDAAEVQPRALRRDAGLYARLLLVALPVTIALGYVLARVLFPSGSAWLALLLAAAVAPTDAGLGAATVLNPVVPVRVRRLLNVESGLNDGLVTPVVLLAISAASGAQPHHPVTTAVIEMAIGIGTGIALGAGCGRLLSWSARAQSVQANWLPIATMSVPLASYYGAQVVHGNGFVAAFVAGTAFAAASHLVAEERGGPLDLATGLSTALSCAVWWLFGVVIVAHIGDLVSWQAVVFAVVALTLLRMAPVDLVLLGTGLTRRTRWFIGWFGPRGLASVIFGLLAVEDLEGTPGLAPVLGGITVTVVLSIICHGLTAGVGAARYGRWVDTARPVAESSVVPAPAVVRGRRRSA
jgi:sodium/hydrogen antiporter